jgi:hypothetical protein
MEPFISMLSKHITHEEQISLEISKQLATHMNEAEKELRTLLDDEQQQPITYSYYFADNVQKTRQNASRDLINMIVKETVDDDFHGAIHISNNGLDVKNLVSSLQSV